VEQWQLKQTISDADPRLKLGYCAQAWYAVNSIFAPADVQVSSSFYSSEMSDFKLVLNQKTLLPGSQNSVAGNSHIYKSAVTLPLKKGWNQIFVRGTCVGYPPLTTGLTLNGPSSTLWGLRLAAKAGSD
jgi:hypothetical protein